MSGWKQLDVGIVGGGIGGLAAAISLRRAGHKVTVYERAHFAGEQGASISCAANGTRWLHHWGVDVKKGRPVVLEKLVWHDWKSGDDMNVYDLADYKDKWGNVYNMFHRVDMHQMLMDCALQEEGEGTPARLVLDHKCADIDTENGEVLFENGVTVKHDVVIGADGVGSSVREIIGIIPDKTISTSTCLHANVPTERARVLGLRNFAKNNAIEYWGGQGIDKIVLSPCKGGKLLSFYCFFPREKETFDDEGWNYEASLDELLAPYPELDKAVIDHLKVSEDIRPWRLWVHQPYPYWHKGIACIMGDAAHPMMPDQSQGACQAIEDAAALGICFSKKHFTGDVNTSLRLYESVRKPRATRVQQASQRARENIAERIGFSSNTNAPNYKVADEGNRLTIEEMNLYDMHKDVAQKASGLVQASL